MISTKICVLRSFICIALISSLNAQEDKTAADKVSPVAQQLVGLHHTLSAQKSLSLIAVCSGHVEPGFGHDDSPDFTATFKLFYKGNRFLYDVEYGGPKGPSYSQVEAFDGTRYTRFDQKGGMLFISSKPFVKDVVMCQGHVFFRPFQFLQTNFSADPFAQVSYDQLTNKDDWRNALASISSASGVEEVELDNQRYLHINKIGKNIDPDSHPDSYPDFRPSPNQVLVFDVYFAKGFNWYPMRWERRSLSTGMLVDAYAVEELGLIQMGNGEKIPYPKKSFTKHYHGGKLRDTEWLEVKQIQFNAVGDEQVAIDPASARVINDYDTGARIKVPR